MKRFSFLLAMLALALVVGLAFVGCDNGTGGDTTKFEGSWKGGWNLSKRVDVVFTFTGNRWEYSSTDTTGEYVSKDPSSGTFTFNETSITFTTSGTNSVSWVILYTLIGDELRFTGSSGNNITRVGGVTLQRQ